MTIITRGIVNVCVDIVYFWGDEFLHFGRVLIRQDTSLRGREGFQNAKVENQNGKS